MKTNSFRLLIVMLTGVVFLSLACAAGIDDAAKRRDWNQVKKEAADAIAKGNKSADNYRKLGIAYAATGDTTAAIENLLLAIKESKKDGKAVLTLTQYYVSSNRLIEARQVARDGMKAAPKSLEMQAARALALAFTDSISEASSLIWKVVSAESNNPEYYKIQGLISRKEGVVDFVIEAFQKALSLDSLDNDIRFELGQAYSFAKRGGDAFETFKRVRELEPNYPGVNYRIGSILYYNARGDNKKFEEALPYLEAAAKEKPGAEVYRLLGGVYTRLNRVAEAETVIRKSLAMNDDINVRKTLADVLMIQKKFDEATEIWRPMVGAPDFDLASFQKFIDITQAFLGRDPAKYPIIISQIELLKKAIPGASDPSGLTGKIGVLYYSVDQYDSSIVWLKRRLESDPKNSSAWINLGYAHSGKEQLDEALTALRKGLALNDSSIAPYQYVADILQKQKKEKEAIALLDSISTRPEFDAKWHLRLASLYYGSKQYSKAVATLEKADARYPGNADIWVWIGINRYSQYAAEPANKGLLNQAKSAFRKALEINPDNTDAKDYLKQLSK